MDESFKWTDKTISDFLNGVKTGNILSNSCGHTNDNYGPLTTFSFPEYFCEIHVHWKNEDREQMSVAHIKDLRINKWVEAAVDTYTVSMLRHFSGLDDKQKTSNIEPKLKKIENIFDDLNYEKREVNNSIFSEAFVIKKKFTLGGHVNFAFFTV